MFKYINEREFSCICIVYTISNYLIWGFNVQWSKKIDYTNYIEFKEKNIQFSEKIKIMTIL